MAQAQPQPGAFYSGEYRNPFAEMLGKNDKEIQAKLDAAWEHLFYGDDDTQRVYYPVGDNMAYIVRRQNRWDKKGEKQVETFPPFRYAVLCTN
jgi:hypothetical protein